MTNFSQMFGECFAKHVGTHGAISTQEAASALQVSDETIRRWTLGLGLPNAATLHLLAKLGKRHPEMVRELFACILGEAWSIERSGKFDPEELDIDGDGDVDLNDAALHQARASHASTDATIGITSKNNLDGLQNLSFNVIDSTLRASACVGMAR